MIRIEKIHTFPVDVGTGFTYIRVSASNGTKSYAKDVAA